MIRQPGFHPEITCAEYFAEPCPAPALTSSGIKMLSPLGSAPAKFAYHHPAIGQPAEERDATVAQHIGRLVHRLALGKGEDYAISPFDEYRSNEAKAWRSDTEAAGVMPVKRATFDEAEQMAAIIRDRIAEACAGYAYDTEVVIAWQEEVNGFPIWCRAMLDVWCPDLLLALDVKTIIDATDDSCTGAFARGYAVQDCFYLRGLNKVTGEPGRARFGFLFVEKEAPYLARSGASTESFRHGAKQDIERAMGVFAACMKSGDWPGYQPFQAYPPSWLLSRWTSAEMMEIAA